ncbi:MAG: ShlB/FhaC/HecB family hemolysin secretion/activation protein [Ectothiorhodospiraceae bacterium]|nr:ShlB/FhaC/HecB family hemolysin secretion/activation protein [Ectothiorhodospiraceae bacterium]
MTSGTRCGALAALVLVLSAAGSSSALAQVGGAVRSTLPEPAREAPPAAPPAEVTPPAQPAAPSGGPTIRIVRFEVEGNTVLSDEELQAAVAEYVGRDLTLLQIYDVADRLTNLYRDRGYTVASVTVPAQKVAGGVIRLEAVEGRIGKIAVEGNDRYRRDVLAAYVDSLGPGDILVGERLERDLLLLNDLPGLRGRSIVQPGEDYGTTDVLVRVEEDPFSITARADNYGRETIGEFRLSSDVFINNITGVGDQAVLSVLQSEGNGLSYGRGEYSLPIGTSGTRAAVSASRYVFRVEPDKANLVGGELKGDGQSLRAQVTHPLIRTRTRNLAVGAAVSSDDSDELAVFAGLANPTEQHLNSAQLFASASQIHADSSVTQAAVTFSTNLRDNPDGTRNNAQKGKFELELSHARRLLEEWTLFARAAGVLALDPLMDIDRYRIGGPGSVRGFPSAEVAGDDGFVLTVQASRRVKIADGVPGAVRVFWDGGVVHRKAEARAVSGETARESLTSVGVGFNLSYAEHYTLDVEVARPLNSLEPSDGQDSGRIWGVFSARF